MKRILLHICCANCATYTVDALRNEDFNVTGYWFNHNIHPYTEYRRRLETLLYYAEKVNLNLIMDDRYEVERFLKHALIDTSFPKRCIDCYKIRLEETARIASSEGFDSFTTTLLYSKYQQHDQIVESANKMASKYGVDFTYRDFRRGWKDGIRISKAMKLYRQQYCGCIFSERDRFAPEDPELATNKILQNKR
jgi:predicted adenine nucleotide alpha hydrolase (AANH) superfamily ATPase